LGIDLGKVLSRLLIVVTAGFVLLSALPVGVSLSAGTSQIMNLQSDSRHTGLGHVNTSTNPGGIEWDFQITNNSVYGGEVMGTSVAQNGDIYFTSSQGWLYSLDPNGSLRWKLNSTGQIYTMPVIGKDGSILFICGPSLMSYSPIGNLTTAFLISVGSDGIEQWRHDVGTGNSGVPLVSDDGLIYTITEQRYMTCLGSNGSMLWDRYVPDLTGTCSPAIFGDFIYVSTTSEVWKMSRSDGSLLGSYILENNSRNYPYYVSIGSDGTIYVGMATASKTLYALTSDLTLKWKFSGSGSFFNAPSIGKDGTLYVGSMIYFDSNGEGVISNTKVYALAPDGKIKWSVSVNSDVISTVIVSNDSRIYAATWDRLYCIDSNGLVIWTANGFTTSNHQILRPVPLAFSNDGSILVPTNVGLCAIGPGRPCPPNNVQIRQGPNQNEFSWTYPADGGSPITGYKLSRWTYYPVSQTSDELVINLTSDRLTYIDQDINRSRQYSYSIASVNINGVGPSVFINDQMPSSEPNSMIYLGAILAGIWALVIVIVIWERRKGHTGEQP
jgi:hypothetical protein